MGRGHTFSTDHVPRIGKTGWRLKNRQVHGCTRVDHRVSSSVSLSVRLRWKFLVLTCFFQLSEIDPLLLEQLPMSTFGSHKNVKIFLGFAFEMSHGLGPLVEVPCALWDLLWKRRGRGRRRKSQTEGCQDVALVSERLDSIGLNLFDLFLYTTMWSQWWFKI